MVKWLAAGLAGLVVGAVFFWFAGTFHEHDTRQVFYVLSGAMGFVAAAAAWMQADLSGWGQRR